MHMHSNWNKLMSKNLKLNLSKTVKKSLPQRRFNLSTKDLEKLTSIAEVILGLGAVAGIALVTVVAPNALQLINHAPWARKTYKSWATKPNDQRQKITRSFHYLKSRNLIELIPQGDNFLMKITEKGREKLKEMSLKTLKLHRAKRWDKNWWLVIADIPTDLKSQADIFRKKIKNLGMFTLQKSVWVYPYDVRDEIAFISKYYNLDSYVTTIEAKTLETQDLARLKNHFKKGKVL